jgi:hypothetical protein
MTDISPDDGLLPWNLQKMLLAGELIYSESLSRLSKPA